MVCPSPSHSVYIRATTKTTLVGRLLGPSLPGILLARRARGEYVPRTDSGNCAVLVALHIYEEEWLAQNGGAGSDAMPLLSKAQVMHRAEATGVSREHMAGAGGRGNAEGDSGGNSDGYNDDGGGGHDDDARLPDGRGFGCDSGGGGGGGKRGVGGGDAPFHYDGWSGVTAKLLGGEAPLLRRRGRNAFCLTTLAPPGGASGRAVAAALHCQCHAEGRCRCGSRRYGDLGLASATVGVRGLADRAFLQGNDSGDDDRAATASSSAASSSSTSSSSTSSSSTSSSSTSSSSASSSESTSHASSSACTAAPVLMASGYAPPVPSAGVAPPSVGGARHVAAGSGVRGPRQPVTSGRCGRAGHSARNKARPLWAPPWSPRGTGGGGPGGTSPGLGDEGGAGPSFGSGGKTRRVQSWSPPEARDESPVSPVAPHAPFDVAQHRAELPEIFVIDD